MKKIAIVSYGGLPMPPVKGGAVETLVQALADNNEIEKKIQLTVISTPDEDAISQAALYKNTCYKYADYGSVFGRWFSYYFNGVIRKFFPWLKYQIYPYMFNVVRKLKEEKYDYIILENRPEFAPYIKRKCKTPVLLHMHNDYFDRSYYASDKLLAFVDKVFAVSDYVKDCISTIDGHTKKISILRNVIDTERFSSVSRETGSSVRLGYGIGEGEFVFAFFGRLIEEKGVRELLEAFSLLRKKHTNVRLLIVGAEWFSSEDESEFIKNIKSKASELGDSVIFSGYVDYGVIQNQYACADAVVVPSIIGEACGLVVLESMASGKALVVSNSGGIPEHVDESCAIIAERGEDFVNQLYAAMNKLASDKELAHNMGSCGKKRSVRYDRKNYLDALLKLIGD